MTGTPKETWEQWKAEGAPDPPLITRAELLEAVQRLGLDADERDLRYWETPPPDPDTAVTLQTVTTTDTELHLATGAATRPAKQRTRLVWRDADRKVVRVKTTGDRTAGADATDAGLQTAGIDIRSFGLQFAGRGDPAPVVEDDAPAMAPPAKPEGECKTRDCRNLAMVEGYCPWHDPNRRDQLHRERQYDHYAAAGA